jgi:uncharacterized membrane protein
MSTPIEPTPAPASGAPGGKTSFMNVDSNLGAMLCYIANFACCLGVVLSIVFVVTEKQNRFVRFHALQALFLALVQIAFVIILEVLGVILGLVLRMVGLSFLSGLLTWGFGIVLFLIFIIFWIIAGIKAYGGQWYKLPIIGGPAFNMANK